MVAQESGKGSSRTDEGGLVEQGKRARINLCHDFAWSRSLWKKAAGRMARACIAFIVVYFIVAVILAQQDGLEGIDVYYFIVMTITTIGLGDISPQGQLNRACAVIVLHSGSSLSG